MSRAQGCLERHLLFIGKQETKLKVGKQLGKVAERVWWLFSGVPCFSQILEKLGISEIGFCLVKRQSPGNPGLVDVRKVFRKAYTYSKNRVHRASKPWSTYFENTDNTNASQH